LRGGLQVSHVAARLVAPPQQGGQVGPAAAGERRGLAAGRDPRHGRGGEVDGAVEVGLIATGEVPRAERRAEPGHEDTRGQLAFGRPGSGGPAQGLLRRLVEVGVGARRLEAGKQRVP
jgi:hypothetical protein